MFEGLCSSLYFEIKWYLKRFSPATHTTLRRICSTVPGVLMVAWLPLVARTGDTLEKISEKPISWIMNRPVHFVLKQECARLGR